MSAGEEKTEEPTAKKKSDARKKGNIPKSKDLSAAAELLGAITILKYIGPYLAHQVGNFTRKILEIDMPNLAIPERKEILPYALDWVLRMFLIMLPFLLLLCLICIIVSVYQVGFNITTEPLKLNLNKLNPISGLKRIFSAKNMVMLVMNIAKLVIIMAVAWTTIISEVKNVLIMMDMETAGTFIYATNTVLSLAQRLAILLLILGLIDYIYQKYNHNKSLKMTKQEVKEEFKQMEGDPKVKGERRKRQMQQAMQRMMSEVPQAEVVVRNPTHFAVAISYKPGMPAPVVVAKGKDKIAEKIIAAAREARVPLVENPPLARELYKAVEVGESIPEELFAAVAEILASVMDAEKKQRLMRELREDAA